MTSQFYMLVTQGGAYPADPYSVEVWNTFKVGETVAFEKPKRPRNLKFHRLFFGALKVLFDNQSMYSVQDDLREDIAIALGHFTIETYRGKQAKRAKSISFAKMDDDAFREFFDGFVKLACERIAPHLDAETFKEFNEVLDGNSPMLGTRTIKRRAG